jgi:hypothetical protein
MCAPSAAKRRVGSNGPYPLACTRNREIDFSLFRVLAPAVVAAGVTAIHLIRYKTSQRHRHVNYRLKAIMSRQLVHQLQVPGPFHHSHNHSLPPPSSLLLQANISFAKTFLSNIKHDCTALHLFIMQISVVLASHCRVIIS